MSFLDDFKEDMRTLTHTINITDRNSIGELVVTDTNEETIKAILTPIWIITDDMKHIAQQIEYSQSTHLLRYDHHTYTLHRNEQIIDDLGMKYTIKLIEPVIWFGGIIEHFTAYLLHTR